MFLGYTVSCNGNFRERNLYDRRIQEINAMLTDFAMNSKISPVFGIWLQKNHFGYSETKQIEIIPPQENHKTLEQQITESNLIWDDETGEFIPKE